MLDHEPGKVDVGLYHDPVPAGETSPIGQVVTGGLWIDGSSEPDRFHVAYNLAWAAPLRASRTGPAYRFG